MTTNQSKTEDTSQIVSQDTWADYEQRLGYLDITRLESLPDFLVIAPPKTGTTWLSKNLSCHPEIYIPAIKELKYFSSYWQWLDINWYLAHFENAKTLIKGEASPSYAILPTQAIQLIHRLKPDLKLIFLIRDPVSRAWSHAKHNFKYHEANFQDYIDSFESIPDEKFIENFTHEWPHSYGDYQKCLKRWLSFFPKEQFYIGFYESIANNPEGLLVEIFNHLEIKNIVNWTEFPLYKRILPGLDKELPSKLKSYLGAVYQRQTEDLINFLRDEFQLNAPSEWANTLDTKTTMGPILLEQNYEGFDIYIIDGDFYGLSSKILLENIVKDDIPTSQKCFECIKASSPDEAKYLIQNFLLPRILLERTGKSLSAENKLVDLDTLRKRFIDQRVKTVLNQEARLSDYQLMIEEGYEGFNILLFRGEFYALAFSLGKVNLVELDEGTLNRYKENSQCIVNDSLDQVKQMITRLSLPELIEGKYFGFNLVGYRNKFYALAQSLGPMDLTKLTDEMLNEYRAARQCFIGDSIFEIKHFLAHYVYELLEQEITELRQELITKQNDLTGLQQELQTTQQVIKTLRQGLELANREIQEVKSSRWFKVLSWVTNLSRRGSYSTDVASSGNKQDNEILGDV